VGFAVIGAVVLLALIDKLVGIMVHELAVLPRFEIRPLSEAEGSGDLVEFPDLPGCVADGEPLRRRCGRLD